MLVGKTKAGKTSTMKTLLGDEPCSTPLSPASQTTESKKRVGQSDGQKVRVIETPGFFNTKMAKDEVEEEIVKCIALAAPGPHVFLYVLKPEAFTKEDHKALEIFKNIFGKESMKYTLALFTHGDEKNKIPEEIITEFSGRYHSFDNKKRPTKQVPQLLEKIKDMVKENQYYTNKMFKEAEEYMRGRGVIPGNATQDALEQVANEILNVTMDEPFKSLLKGILQIIREKEENCTTQ